VTSRSFRDGDLSLLAALAKELYPDVQGTYGQVAWGAAVMPHGDWEARLWYDGDTLAGWGWLTGETELEFEVRGSHRELLDAILEWAQPQELMVRSDNEDAIARIRAHGLEHDPNAAWIRENRRSLDEIEAPRLPDGYTLRTVTPDDWESRAAAHRSAFHPSRFSDEVYAFVRSTPDYRPDLDCVAAAPDGSIAAYTLAWLDDVNKVGELEPVGTHADHRRRGLGRAVNLYALQQLREGGATTGMVACRGDDAYPIPRALYESVGFRECWRKLAFTKQ
jgi:ribosomal protein S18 acetylase RimI-like enzyme